MLPKRLLLGCVRSRQLWKHSERTTFILEHVYAPPAVGDDGVQRPPHELKRLQQYRVVEIEDQKPAGPLKVILLQDIEGIGNQFDVVEVDRKLARSDLLLTRKAVYASPFDLQYYARKKEEIADELAARVRVPFELTRVGRELMGMVVPLCVSMENPWTLNATIVKSALRQAGVDITDAPIHLSPQPLTGPNFEMEARLIRFYVVVSQQYIVPMLGRISHISTDETKEVS